jgi:hypothetical protein
MRNKIRDICRFIVFFFTLIVKEDQDENLDPDDTSTIKDAPYEDTDIITKEQEEALKKELTERIDKEEQE